MRSLDVLVRGTHDEVVFEHAAANDLVWVTSDERALVLPSRYLKQERRFVGMLVWRQEDRYHMRPGDFVRKLMAIEDEPDPFAAGYRFIQPD